MEGLRTARVAVVDDEPEEAMDLLRAIAKLGVATAFFDGSVDDLPETPIAGLRLVFLDMILTPGQVDAQQAVGQVMSVADRLVPADTRSVIPVIWTKHPDLIAAFSEAWRAKYPQLQHLPILPLPDKATVARDPNGLGEEIRKTLLALGPVDLLWAWEESVHTSSAATTDQLSALVTPVDGDWFKGLNGILGALAYAEGGKTAGDSTGAVRSTYGALNRVLEDLLSASGLTMAAGGLHADSVAAIAKAAAEQSMNVPAAVQAVLNRLLLLEYISPGDKEPLSGNLYLLDGWEGVYPIRPEGPIALADIVDTICKTSPDRLEAITNAVVPALLEITPSCDVVQRRAKYARLVTALFVPLEANGQGINVRSGDAIRALGRVELKGGATLPLNGTYRLLVTAIPVSGVPMEKLRESQPALRLRLQGLAEIQAWFSAHASRPGLTNFPG